MVSVTSLLSLSSFLALQLSQVQAASLGSDPTAVDPNAPQFLSELKGTPIGRTPPQYSIVKDGKLLVINGTEVVREEAMMEDAQTGLQNSDLEALAQVLNTQFTYNADEIKNNWKSGRTQKVAWPSSYWPSYQDGINQVWTEAPSPAEKYARATGKNIEEFMDSVSAAGGIDSFSSYQSCTDQSQCPDGLRCGIRVGRSSGYCVPSWAGICHGWAPAAVLEPEPRCPVDFNGVNFQPFDLKGLMTQVYADAPISVRYVGVLVDGNDNDDSTDMYGRFTKLDHRDIGPAAFHIVAANVMGRDQKDFLFDLSPTASVWNQPALSYEFGDPWEMNPDFAAQVFLGASSYAEFNPDAKKIHYMTTTFKYVNEGYQNGPLVPRVDAEFSGTKVYNYLLELDDDNNIIGGEWVGASRTDHPDIIWVALEGAQPGLVTKLDISYDIVRFLVYMSAFGQC